ncbi:MAG: DNA repair protein RecN [Clostridiales bacterium]|nr:DNA repair protein RecN [Clostridiales bacterium]
MLSRVLIRQFAIIEQLEMDFRPPFTVLTGETGAGKSILIEAISILLGGRSAAEMIRQGADKAYIEGVFHFTAGHPVYEALAEGGWSEKEEDFFVLSRELNVNGRNPCRINGYTVSLQVYRQLASTLMDIHGQHEYQQLMQSQRQLDIFDSYGGKPLQDLRQQVTQAYTAWKKWESQLLHARENQQAFIAKKDFLQFQLQEIDALDIRPGEDEALEQEIRKLTYSQRILQDLDRAINYLFRQTDGESAYDLLSRTMQLLKGLGKFDPELETLYENLEPASFLMDEASREMERYKDRLEIAPARLEEAEARLYKIRALGKKYGEGTKAILEHREKTAGELAEMEEFSLREEEWENRVTAAKDAFIGLATALSRLRKDTKDQLEAQIDREFLDLAMQAAHFIADIREAVPGPKGFDMVEFLISTNIGEAYLPLIKIASGGELSRITLAMKRILADSDTCETLVFDEIDSGIGGTTIQAVADKLLSISDRQQVICVTHSPVLAAKANQHYLLEKAEQDGRTLTGIRELAETDRIEELMRMLGGDSRSEDLKRHAASMLTMNQAENRNRYGTGN